MTTESAWIATYLVHSTVLLGAAALLASRRLRPRWREAIWRAALLGGILTATAQVAFAPSPWSIDLPERTAAVIASPAPVPEGSAPAPSPPPEIPQATPLAAREPAPAARAPETTAASALAVLPGVVVLVAVGFSLLAVVRLLGARGALRRQLARRRPVVAEPWRDALDTLARGAGHRGAVRLSVVEGLGSPLARGILRPEICVPERALEELCAEERDALLAHELAHVIRRDALRMAIERAVETLLAVQPLNGLAGRRLREIAELRCDRMAAAWTGRPRVLAGCLTRVATWVLETRAGAWLPAMASRGRLLRDRVRHLTEPVVERRGHRLAGAAALIALAVLGTLLPPITTATASVRPDPGGVETDRPAPDTPAARLRAELDALAVDMTDLTRALETLEDRPVIRSRIGRLAARWESIRKRAGAVPNLSEEEER